MRYMDYVFISIYSLTPKTNFGIWLSFAGTSIPLLMTLEDEYPLNFRMWTLWSFLGDFAEYTLTLQEHSKDLSEVFLALRSYNLQLYLKKFVFRVDSEKLLRF